MHDAEWNHNNNEDNFQLEQRFTPVSYKKRKSQAPDQAKLIEQLQVEDADNYNNYCSPNHWRFAPSQNLGGRLRVSCLDVFLVFQVLLLFEVSHSLQRRFSTTFFLRRVCWYFLKINGAELFGVVLSSPLRSALFLDRRFFGRSVLVIFFLRWCDMVCEG